MRIVVLLASVALASCSDGDGEYDGNSRPDAGFLLELADVGAPCIFDPATGDPPRLQCASGQECVIRVVDDNGAEVINSVGFSLPRWEDEFSMVLEDGRTMGFCSYVADGVAEGFVCPSGSRSKLVSANGGSGFTQLCVRTCDREADCLRPGEVCDVRFFDGTGTCVKPCVTDIPDCVLTEVVSQPPAIPTAATALFGNDYFGGAECGVQGVCQAITTKGIAGLGGRCTRSSDCATGAACLQATLFPDSNEVQNFGFCASPALFDAQSGSTSCTVGTLPQPGLTFGYDIPLVVFPAAADGAEPTILPAVGYCFHQCQSLETCASYAGTLCGSADESVFEAEWNNLAMCLPPVLLNEER